METVALLYEDYQKELAEDFKNTFLKRASDTDSSRSNDTVIDEVTDMLSTNIAVYTEKLLQRWGFSSGGEGGGGGDVTVTLDDLLKKYLSDNYVTIKGDQEVFGEKDFRKGIRIAGRRLYWDEGNDALVIEGAAYTTRWLSAKGVSPGGGGAGSGGAAAMYQLIDVSPNDTKDAVLGAEKDYVLTFDGSFWRGMPNKGGLSSKLFTALDKEGNEVNPDDENAEIYAIRANYSLWSVGFLSAKGISDGGTGGGGGGAVALYQLLDVEKNADITGVAGATKGSVLTFNGDKWYADKPKTAAGISKLFTALDKEGNEVNPDDENAEIYAIRANYSLWSVGFLSAKGISDGGTGGGGGGAVALYQLLDVEKNADITGVAGATKGSVLTFNGDKWYADKPKTAAGISKLFTALDNDGNEVDLNDESKLGTITNIRANYALWSVDWISAKGKSSGGSGGGGGLINLVYGFESLGGTFDNNDNSATFNAFTINEIWKLASSGLTNVTVTGSGNAVTDVIKGSDGRSLTFTKGSTFATKSEFDALNTKFNDFLTGSDADDIINKWSELEVFLQGMKESDNLAVILQSKMDKTAFSKLFTALDASGNEVDPSDDTKTIASIRANFGFWGVDYISAKGVSKGSGGTGGASTLYQLVDVLANDTEDGVEGAAAGKALVFDGTHWRAGDAGLNESQLYSYLTANKYLTQSAADSRYVTSSRKVIAGTGLSGGGALTSDVTLSLGTSGVVAGTYTKVMVDAYGRVTSGTNLSATDIPNLDWSKITTGKPTTLAGYGITDAVTLTTAQTISGRKTFSQNIVFNNNGGITYTDSNVVLRNSDGHTILASFGNGGINLRPNGHNNTEGAVWINKKGNVQAPSVSTNTITIGDAQLVYDSKNKALRVKHRTDGNTVGFYSDGWITALGVQTGGAGGGSGVIKTVYSFANLTDGTTFSNSDLNNTFNAYTVKEIWKMAKEGGGIKNIAQSGSGNAITDMTLSSDGKTITAVFGETFARQQDLGTLNNTVTQLSNKLNNFLEGLTGNDTLTELLALKADKTITISAGTGLSGGGALTSDVTLSLGTSGVVAGTYTKVMVDAYGRVTSGTNLSATDIPNLDWSKITTGKPTTLAGYGITDAVTLTTAQTISGRKTFSQNIVFNNNGGITYTDSNVVLRNSDGHTILASFGNGGINLRPNGHNNTEGAVWINKKGNVQAPSVSTNTITIGDAQLVYDSKNKALRVKHRTDGNTVGFYSDGWITALGVQTGGAGGGSGVIKTVYSFANLTDGTTFSNSDLNNTFNAYTVKEIWKMAKEGGGIKNIAQSGSGNAITDMTLSSDGKTITAVFGETFARQQDLGTLNNTVTQLSNKLNNFLEGLTGNDTLTELLALKADKTITISAGTGLTGGGNLSANRTLSLATTGVKAGTYTKVTVDTYGRVTVGDNPTTLAGYGITDAYTKTEADGRYVKKSGDTMTGDLTMNNTKGFNIGWSTRVVKDSGVWIHGGADAASSADANLRFGSWYGIGWYPTFSRGSVAQGNNAMWLNVRNGNLDTHGAITAHTNYLAANWDSARRLVLGGGSSYAYIDSRNSSNNVLCNIVLEDNKVFIGNYAESSRFVSTVGTGTAPYQCSSTTLNTNLNADLLDNWHIMDIPRNYNSTATYSLQFALGGTDNGWKKIFACSESGTGPWRSVTVWGQIWYAYGNHAQEEVRYYHFCAIFQMRGGETSSGSGVGSVVNSARLYLPTFAKGMDNIRLVRVGTNNFELQVRQIGSYNNGYIQYQYWANGANVSAWRGLQSTSNTSVAVSAGGASTLADSRASSADVWTTARTFYIQDYHSANTGAGVSVNGGSNCYLKLPSTTRFSRIDFSTPNANIRHSGNDNGNEVGSSTLSNLVIDSWYGVSFTTTCSSTYQNKIAMSVNCRTGRVTANNFHAATNITANGAITAKASSSDIRLKTDIQGYDAMGIIRKFRSVKYHWNAIAKENSEVFNHDNWNYGLIAQDLLSGGYSQWVKDAFNDYYTIDYERLIPVVWKGLQEVDDEVTKLKREVARLNKRVKELEKSLCA